MNEDIMNVPRGTIELIEKYISILKKWNETINLVSVNDLKNEKFFWHRHICDSIFLAQSLPMNTKIVDFGSGGGLPAIIIAIFGYEIVMYERDLRKVLFLRHVVQELQLNCVMVVNTDVDNIKNLDNIVVVARGFAELIKIFDLSKSAVTNNTKFMLLKGKKYVDEINNALSRYAFDFTIHKLEKDHETVILEIHNLKKK